MMMTQYWTTTELANAWESTRPLLQALYSEIQELSKKKPDLILNKSKVALINRLLVDLRTILSAQPEFKYLDLLDDESLPQYSDVVLVLAQYDAAMAAFKARHFGRHPETGNINQWFVRQKDVKNKSK